MNQYYKEMLLAGQEFQDHVSVNLMRKRGLPVMNFTSKNYQFTHGENYQGFEIKYDMKFRRTKNLWIEVAERRSPWGDYVQSGIHRKDNALFYLIGDYKGIFLIPLKRIRKIAEEYLEQQNSMKTSKGFLLPVSIAHSEFDYIDFD